MTTSTTNSGEDHEASGPAEPGHDAADLAGEP